MRSRIIAALGGLTGIVNLAATLITSCEAGTNDYAFLTVRRNSALLSSLYCSFSQLAPAIGRTGETHTDMVSSFVDDLIGGMAALPILLPVILLPACVGLGFFIVRLRKRDTRDDQDEASIARRRDRMMLACIGVDLFIIAYVGVMFFLFQFLVDHVDLLR